MWKTRGDELVPPSLWNIVRVPDVVHRPRPFQPALASSETMSPALLELEQAAGG